MKISDFFNTKPILYFKQKKVLLRGELVLVVAIKRSYL